MAKILETKQQFENDILNSSVAMVDFFATWCGPCKMLSPVIDEISEEMEGKAVIAKVDSDNLGDVCQEYAIRILPTLVFFKDGKEVDRIVGVAEKEDILEKLNSLL